jgi:acetyltransferase-like isoleucine patch superfamily enzyme
MGVPNLWYQNFLSRLDDVYPFGKINLPSLTDEHTEPVISKQAKGIIKTGQGAKIVFTSGVSLLRGENKFTVEGEGSAVVVGKGTTFENSLIQINGTDCIAIIGENCRIRGLKIIIKRPNSAVVIGAQTTWESGAIISESGNIVAVGNDCMISNSVILRTSDGHTIFDAETRQSINAPADVLIGHHVWLGNSSRVNKGTIIGSGTVVGQCAIASGEIEPNSVYAGIPAKQKKRGIVWSRTTSYDDIPEEFLI